MRNAFALEVTELAAKDERIVLLSGDIGNRLFDDYKALYPGRFLNTGVAEANMVSVAAGMALCGLRPVVYTITPFVTTRCLEQIRVDVCYQNLAVTLVGVGGGLSYASLGATHHSCEDLAFMRALPHMRVVCPGDAVEVRLALREALASETPVYIRLGKRGEPVIHEQTPEFEIGKGIVVRPGTDVCLLATGNMLPGAVRAADELAKSGISAQVVSFHTVKPLDGRLLGEVFSRYSAVVSVEEHSILGGLGGGIAEWLSDHPGQRARFRRIGTADTFMHDAGEQEYAREYFGLTPERIAEKARQLYQAADSGLRAQVRN